MRKRLPQILTTAMIVIACSVWSFLVGHNHVWPYRPLIDTYHWATGTDVVPPAIGRARLRESWRASSRPQQVVMLGDSLTAGADWASLLSRHDVVNRGIGGDTSSMVLYRLADITDPAPRVVLVMVGINDISVDAPLDTIEANYAEIVRRLAESGARVVIQSVINPREPFTWGDEVAQLNNRLRGMAAEHGVEFLDLQPVLCRDGVIAAEYTTDNLHLSEQGYQAWGKAIQDSGLLDAH